jgi:hypothetical protein
MSKQDELLKQTERADQIISRLIDLIELFDTRTKEETKELKQLTKELKAIRKAMTK